MITAMGELVPDEVLRGNFSAAPRERFASVSIG